MCVDAAAAIGIAKREGLGRVRHVDVGILWIQQRIVKKQLEIAKVAGSENPADLMMKHLERRLPEFHISLMGCELADGKSESAMELLGQLGRSQKKTGKKYQRDCSAEWW